MKFIKKSIFLTLLLVLFSSITVFAEVDENGYEIVRGSNTDRGTLGSAWQTAVDEQNANIDTDFLDKADKKISTVSGTIVGAIIYIIFAMTGFTTACDLLYIGVPFLRPFLYDGSQGQNSYGSANANLIGRNETWTQMANNNMARAGQNQQNANHQMHFAQQNMSNQQQSDAWRAQRNQEEMQRAQNRANNRRNGGY